MRVDNVMTREVQTVRSDTPLQEAARIMVELQVSGLPVVDFEDHVLGVLSESDILVKEAGSPDKPSLLERVLTGIPATFVDPTYLARSAGEAMSAPAVTIGARRSVSEAAKTMIDHCVNRLPVVDGDGTLIGIVRGSITTILWCQSSVTAIIPFCQRTARDGRSSEPGPDDGP